MTRKNFLTIMILLILIMLTGISVSHAATKEAEKFFAAGMKSMKKRQFDKAASYFSKAIDRSPEYKEAWYELGNTRFATGKYNKAMDSYYVALEIDPTYKKALKKTGSCFLKQNNYQMAAFKMEKARDYYPDDPDIRFLLGQAYEGLKQKQKALASYNKARELQSEKYGFLKDKVKLLEESLAANVKSDAPSPTPMLTGPPIPEELPDTVSTPGSAETPDHINETTVAVLEHTSPSPDDSPEEPKPTETKSHKGMDISPEALNGKYDGTSGEVDKRKQILGIIRIGGILTFVLLILTGGLHLLREYIKAQKRRVVLDRLELSKTAAVTGESSGNADGNASSHSSLFKDRWVKQKEEAEKKNLEEQDVGVESDSIETKEKELKDKTVLDNLFLQETGGNDGKNISPTDLKVEVPDFATDAEKLKDKSEEPEHKYFRDVVSGEKVWRRDSSRKLLTKMRKRLRFEDLPDKSHELDSPADSSDETKIGYSKEAELKIDKKEVGGDSPLESSDFPYESAAEAEKKNSESPLKMRPLTDARDMNKRIDPFVCVCGKIVRDGAYICPRCGRGTR